MREEKIDKERKRQLLRMAMTPEKKTPKKQQQKHKNVEQQRTLN